MTFQPIVDFMNMHGGIDAFTMLMCAPLVFVIFDIITGVARAWKDGEISSAVSREGAGHKFGIIMAVGASFILEIGVFVLYGLHFPILIPVIVYIVCSEMISIIENICLLNPQMAGVFAPVLNVLRNSQDEKVKELENLGEIKPDKED